MDASVLSDDSDYDIVSPEASIADLSHGAATVIPEPPPSQTARETFNTCHLSPEDIRAFVQTTLSLSFPASRTRTKRVYVDGIFDGFNVRHALQLRQAKLSFPAVWLVVGVFSARTCEQFGTPAVLPEVERCEVVRHCRWVDERNRIDYVAVEEGATVDPAYDKLRLKGYDELKRNGSVILTRRTTGVVSVLPPRTPVLPEPAADPDTPAGFHGAH